MDLSERVWSYEMPSGEGRRLPTYCAGAGPRRHRHSRFTSRGRTPRLLLGTRRELVTKSAITELNHPPFL